MRDFFSQIDLKRKFLRKTFADSILSISAVTFDESRYVTSSLTDLLIPQIIYFSNADTSQIFRRPSLPSQVQLLRKM